MRQRIDVRRARVPLRSQRIPPSPPSPLCDPPFHISAAPTPQTLRQRIAVRRARRLLAFLPSFRHPTTL
ncbi:hypothetical protein K523DRAFT_422413 [Schizophyllum commune Tattone D]|nr:hypothetical protein K523DRAFT_422413 [Schizophyllum commune Tattone D]